MDAHFLYQIIILSWTLQVWSSLLHFLYKKVIILSFSVILNDYTNLWPFLWNNALSEPIRSIHKTQGSLPKLVSGSCWIFHLFDRICCPRNIGSVHELNANWPLINGNTNQTVYWRNMFICKDAIRPTELQTSHDKSLTWS